MLRRLLDLRAELRHQYGVRSYMEAVRWVPRERRA